MNLQLYPLKFHPFFKEKIWGGSKIRTHLDKDFSPLPNCGETWEISGVEGNVSIVSEGDLEGTSLTGLIDKFGEDLLGRQVVAKYGMEFPLLIKFIDADQDLSIQVHPDDIMAAREHQGKGKTEMWYVLQADEEASLYAGFKQLIDHREYVKRVEEKTITEVLEKVPVEAGDVFYIPAGRVHSIGRGVLLAEIQQTSDLTYRIYDFDRCDEKGNKRELHTELAVQAIQFEVKDDYKTPYRLRPNEVCSVVECPFFSTQLIELEGEMIRDLSSIDSFVIYICTRGKGILICDEHETIFRKGDVVLIPASFKSIELLTSDSCTLIETFIPET